MKRIFFFDIDGTLCYQNQVSPRVCKAIKRIQENGDLCFIATGRPPTFLQECLKEVGFDGYIFANGACAIYKDELLYQVKMEPNTLRNTLKELRDKNCEYILQTVKANYIHKDYHKLYDFFKKIGIPVETFIKEFDEESLLEDIIKIEIWPDYPERVDEFRKSHPEYKWHQYINSNIEIYLNTLSKAFGIKEITRLLNIDYENTYCFGDDFNDIEMFKAVKHSYAMGNAHEKVKKEATNQCPSVEEDGVAYILEQL